MTSTSRTRTVVKLAALATTIMLLGTTPVAAAPADDDYPTWAEVEAAQSSEANSKAEYQKLQQALKRAQGEAETASVAALNADETSRKADAELTEATARQTQIKAKLKKAKARLDTDSDAVGRTVSWLYRDGTGMARLNQLATSADPEDYMAKLSASTQVAGSWDTLAKRAAAAVNTVTTLEDQASEAKEERAKLATAARDAAAQAEQASQEADAAVATTTKRTDTIYKQLATLKHRTASVERRYQLGLAAAEEARRRREAQAAAAAAGGGGGGGGGGSSSGGSPSTSGVSVDPAGAQAHARSAIGAYGWGGGQFDCLVNLWNGESGWRADALNASSGAYGIPQSLPAEKMATAGADWRTNGNTQVDWGLAYIRSAYGSPCTAWNTWNSRWPHWY